jgi:hypothetical protein
MEAILKSSAFWQWIGQVMTVFFLIGGIVCVAVGVSLIVNSQRTLRFFGTMNRWVSLRSASRPLEIPRDTTQAVQKRRYWLGALFIAGGAYATYFLATRYSAGAAIQLFNLATLPAAFAAWIADSARWILIAGNLAAIAVGVLLAFSPATLAALEAGGSRWFSERQLLKGADTQNLSLDKWVATYPRRAGVIIVIGALLMLGNFGITLLGTR